MGFLKRTICIVLAAVLMLSLLPVGASAASYKNTYRNTGNQRRDIIGVALTQIGYIEGANNANKYGAWYRLNNEPWCAIFVTWCARQAGIPTSVLRSTAVASPNADTAQVEGKHFGIAHFDGQEYTPLPGDLFFTKTFSHTGLVCYVSGEYFYTIEGNSNAAGSDEGGGVVCNRRRIRDFYFGVPNYDTATEAPAAAAITTDRTDYRQGENQVGDTITFSWEGEEEGLSRTLDIYYRGVKIKSETIDGQAGSYTMENALAGGYLAAINTKKNDGSTLYNLCEAYVKEPYMLRMQYHTGGASVSPHPKYRVTADVLYLRARSDINSSRLAIIERGTILTITDTYQSYDYLWGKTEYLGISGWVAIHNRYMTQDGLYSDETGLIRAYRNTDPVQTCWEYGQGSETGLMNAEELDLVWDHHTFVGWSETPDGSGKIYEQDAPLTTQDIRPTFRYEDITIDLYPVWQKNVSAVSVHTPADKTVYYTGESLDLTGLSLDVSYTDGSLEIVTDGISASGFSSSTPGEKTVTLHYNDVSVTMVVSVLNRLLTSENSGGAVVDGYVGAEGEIMLPSTAKGLPITAISNGAFQNSSALTGILVPHTVIAIGQDAFAGCTGLTTVYFTGTQAQWDAIAMGSGNEALQNAQIQFDYCILGDTNGDRNVNNADVVQLLWYILFPDTYSVVGTADINGDGVANNADVILLLWHTLYPEDYPLPH